MHLPLPRTGDFLATLGLDLASSTMFGGPLLMMDGTGMKVLQPGETGTHRGQFVVYCNDELTVYDDNPSKEAHHFESFLRVGEHDELTGLVVADHANNMGCLDTGERTRCGCWQHARNNFKDARVSAPVEAEEAIARIGTFVDVEPQADASGDSPGQRLARRRREIVPLIDGFERWIAATQHRFDPDEDLCKAILYLPFLRSGEGFRNLGGSALTIV